MTYTRNIFTLLLFLTIAGAGVFGCTPENKPTGKESLMSKNNPAALAPEFPEGLEWLNTNSPLTLAGLKGKFVLLDFWTFCCINCMHIIPDLKKLEEKYSEELVVIGVHSAKFLNEKETGNIRQAVLRYGIEHPVVNDKDFEIWSTYGVNSWPTVFLIDPNGEVIGKLSGEGIYDPIDQTLEELLPKYENVLDRTVPSFALEKNKQPAALLNFPGKILADEKSGRLFITDSNNNRILIASLEGEILDVIGSGTQGAQNGTFDNAQFFMPQGTALCGDDLYIADTENHLVRRANLKMRSVETIAGTGKQVYVRNPSGKAKVTGLNSPWDLVIIDSTLFIAMAGPHQLWTIDLKTGNIRLHAGSGHENIIDGTLLNAALAQPSGITTDGKKLYFADSEVSAIRSADIDTSGSVKTIIGKGLFEYGDIDGSFREARLQHPLGIVFVNGLLYAADTYNNKIKLIDPLNRMSLSFSGTGVEGAEDGNLSTASFNEPAGITYAKGKLYVADTNNHLIRVIDIASGKVSTLVLTSQKSLKRIKEDKERLFEPANFHGETKVIEGFNLADASSFDLQLLMPAGYKLNPNIQSLYRVISNEKETASGTITSLQENISFPKNQTEELYIELVIYYCSSGNEGVCMIKDILFRFKNDLKGIPPPLVISCRLFGS